MNTFLLGNSLELLPKFQKKCANICVTSPPYKDSDGYSDDLMRHVFEGIHCVLLDDSLFFLNFGHLAEDKFRPFRVCSIAMECGFKLNETVVWVKNHYKPIQGDRRLNNLSEFIFILYKGKMPKLDRLAIGVPYADKSNAKRFAGGRDLKCRGNVWHIPYENIHSSEQKLHNDRFPLALPKLCIKLAGLSDTHTLIDPFAGSGTSLVAAKEFGLGYIGIEKNPIHYDTAVKRLELTQYQV